MQAAQFESRGPSMPRVTLYVKDSDAGIWDRARALTSGSEDSLSSFVSDALQVAVMRRERQLRADRENADHFETIELEGVEPADLSQPKKLRFVGLLVHEDKGSTVYITRGKKIVVESGPDGALNVFDSFEDFEEVAKSYKNTSVIHEVADALGEQYFEEIE